MHVVHTDKLTLRPGVEGDAPEVTALFLASRRDALSFLPEIHTDEETRHFIANVVFASCVVWVAELDGRIVGFMALNGHHLDHLYVRPGYYRRGVGSALMAKARTFSPDKLTLYTFQRNIRARAFYEDLGFRAVEFGDGSENEEGEPDVLYEWLR